MDCLNEEKHSQNKHVCVFLETKLRELRHRVFVLDVGASKATPAADKDRNRLTTSHVNQHEADAVNSVIDALEEMIPGDHILALAAYKLQSNLLKHGSSVPGAQGASRNIVLYSVCAYGGMKLSMNGHILNTAATRARSLFIVVADVARLRNNLPAQKLHSHVRCEDVAAIKNLIDKVMPVPEFIQCVRGDNISGINAHFDELAKTKPAGHFAKRRRKAGP